jgi:hypothetical protein
VTLVGVKQAILRRVNDEQGHQQVAVVRVEIRAIPGPRLLIELLEIGLERPQDRVLGRTSDVEEACGVLGRWLQELADPLAGPACAGSTTTC